jgi:hypothetical protein
MVLAAVHAHGGAKLGLVVFREGRPPVDREKGYYLVLAKSYTLRYLLAVGKANS